METMDDFKKLYPIIADALIAEGRALESGGAPPDARSVPWHVIPEGERHRYPHTRTAKPATGAVVAPERATATATAADATDQSLRREWDSSPAVRGEFADYACFAAFRRAEARGAVKLLRKSN